MIYIPYFTVSVTEPAPEAAFSTELIKTATGGAPVKGKSNSVGPNEQEN